MVISDSTGETATNLARVTMKQFQQYDLHFTRYKNIRTIEQIDAIFTEAPKSHDLIIYTVVDKELRSYISQLSRTNYIRSLDLLGPILTSFSNIFETEPQNKPGLAREVNEEYFHKIRAIEFTLNHDDGKHLDSLYLSDIVLIGISRTSKTPLSIYLSLHGIKVVNIPLIYGVELPAELKNIDPRKVFGLTINPETLYDIRRNRLQKLGTRDHSGSYATWEEVIKEVEWANKIFSKNKKWSVFDITDKALEETATDILHLIEMKEHNIFKKEKNK